MLLATVVCLVCLWTALNNQKLTWVKGLGHLIKMGKLSGGLCSLRTGKNDFTESKHAHSVLP